jgi:uncharacterized damage-inducible protein DinB
MKRILILIIVLASFFTVKAQPADSLQVQLARKWINSKAYALKLADLMPEDGYDFKATPEEMTFREQLLHIADNINWLSSSYLLINGPVKTPSGGKLTKDDVIKKLGEAYDLGLKAHMKMNTGQMDEKVKFFAGPITRRQILILMHDHQTHHLGQLIVYLRLKGIKPPDYIGW